MTTLTIPKKLAQMGDLVVIPKGEYEAFSLWKKTVAGRSKETWFWTPEWQQKEIEANIAIKTGKMKGPFFNHKSLLVALKKVKTSK